MKYYFIILVSNIILLQKKKSPFKTNLLSFIFSTMINLMKKNERRYCLMFLLYLS